MSMETEYLKNHLNDCLTLCLAEVCEKRPADPIEYMAQWMYKYVENKQYRENKEREAEQLKIDKVLYEKELIRREQMREEKARLQAIEEEKRKAEEERKKREVAAAAAAAKLATVVEAVEPVSMPSVEIGQSEGEIREGGDEGEGDEGKTTGEEGEGINEDADADDA